VAAAPRADPRPGPPGQAHGCGSGADMRPWPPGVAAAKTHRGHRAARRGHTERAGANGHTRHSAAHRSGRLWVGAMGMCAARRRDGGHPGTPWSGPGLEQVAAVGPMPTGLPPPSSGYRVCTDERRWSTPSGRAARPRSTTALAREPPSSILTASAPPPPPGRRPGDRVDGLGSTPWANRPGTERNQRGLVRGGCRWRTPGGGGTRPRCAFRTVPGRRGQPAERRARPRRLIASTAAQQPFHRDAGGRLAGAVSSAARIASCKGWGRRVTEDRWPSRCAARWPKHRPRACRNQSGDGRARAGEDTSRGPLVVDR